MSKRTYTQPQSGKPLVWLHGEIKTPPFGRSARLEAGVSLRRLQLGELLAMPHSRPVPALGRGCHELRIRDAGHRWRILYRIDDDAVVIVEIFTKKTRRIPDDVIETCRKRLKRYDDEQAKAESPRS